MSFISFFTFFISLKHVSLLLKHWLGLPSQHCIEIVSFLKGKAFNILPLNVVIVPGFQWITLSEIKEIFFYS